MCTKEANYLKRQKGQRFSLRVIQYEMSKQRKLGQCAAETNVEMDKFDKNQ